MQILFQGGVASSNVQAGDLMLEASPVGMAVIGEAHVLSRRAAAPQLQPFGNEGPGFPDLLIFQKIPEIQLFSWRN